MGLNRVQKRNLAIVLVSQAQEVVEDWHSFKQKQYPGVPEDALTELSQDDVRHRFAGWLQYLPGKPAAAMLLGEGDEIGDDEVQDAQQDIVSETNDPNQGNSTNGVESSDQPEPQPEFEPEPQNQASFHSSYSW